MLVQLDGQPVERKPDGMAAVEQARFAAHIAELGEAGADEVIVVASPITERSIRALGELLRLGDGLRDLLFLGGLRRRRGFSAPISFCAWRSGVIVTTSQARPTRRIRR